jgi:hypothetical protein
LRFRIHFIFAALTLIFVATSLFPAENLTANLIIVGPGDPIYTYWGHIGISMKNSETGENLFYDFGNFSFYSENFYRDFAMGRMMYLGMVTPTERFLSYSLSENRDLTVYPLNLGEEELQELDRILRWWVLPENREYLYDYFKNNCSTIIRDILNDVTGGALKDSTEQIPDRTFRHYARTGSDPSFFAEVLLDYLLGSDLDKPITGWDKMFLPLSVAESAMRLKYTGEDGETRILADEGIILKKSSRRPVPDEPRMLWPVFLLTGLAAALLWRLSASPDRKAAGVASGIYRVLIILSVGIPGLVLAFLMTFTDHASAYRNINLWPSFPTVLAGLVVLFLPLRKKEIYLSWIWTINLIGFLLAVILRISGIYIQDAFAFWFFYGPLTLAASRPGLWIEERIRKTRNSL